jgi:hypothetical protein
MKNATLCYLLTALLLSASACKKDADVVIIDKSELCAPTSSYAKPATDRDGVVNFDQTLQQYVIISAIPGTYDSVDIGVVCGKLPGNFRTAGTKVRFSGIYHGYAQNPVPSAGPVGTTYYYLELSTIAKL